MKPLSSIKGNYIVYLAFLLLFTASCHTTDNSTCLKCADKEPLNPNINLSITDKLTNNDLFFGKQARFSSSQLKLYHIVNGKPDSCIVKIDSAKQLFNINLRYKEDIDTVAIRIGNMKPDSLFISNDVADQCCLHIYVTSALFNGSIVYKDSDNTYKAKDTSTLKVIKISK
jgi:hypothetical protein